MVNPYPVVVRTVADLTSVLTDIKRAIGLTKSTISPWFRGVSDESNSLKPSIYRCEVDRDCERELIRDFKIYSKQMGISDARPDIEWMFLAQHFGLPTRVLDWTENALTALYFSAQPKIVTEKDGKTSQPNGRIYVLDPWSLNVKTQGIRSVFTTDNPIMSKYVIDLVSTDVPRRPESANPIAVRPVHIFDRSYAQHGVCTIHGHEEKAISRNHFRGVSLEELKVPAENKSDIIEELFDLGIHRSSLFRSQDALSETLRYKYSRSRLGIKPPPHLRNK